MNSNDSAAGLVLTTDYCPLTTAFPVSSSLFPLPSSLFQCVPNFSEGRRQEVVAAIADAVCRTPGACLIDCSADVDHNRSVLTYLGDAAALRAASLASGRIAVEKIDMRAHEGVHPRTGAIDVLPIIPIRNTTREEAVALAQEVGADLARDLGLPVYFYEWAARPGRRDMLPDLRRGGYERFATLPLTGDYAPDEGPAAAHPSAGIAIVGARGPLVAYNIDLATSEVEAAQRIAWSIRRKRDRRPELEGVRALGLYLTSRDRAQVSMNLTHPAQTPLPSVYAFVRDEAQKLGTEVAESEIIGVIPRAALGGQPPEAIRWLAYKPSQILENWLV